MDMSDLCSRHNFYDCLPLPGHHRVKMSPRSHLSNFGCSSNHCPEFSNLFITTSSCVFLNVRGDISYSAFRVTASFSLLRIVAAAAPCTARSKFWRASCNDFMAVFTWSVVTWSQTLRTKFLCRNWILIRKKSVIATSRLVTLTKMESVPLSNSKFKELTLFRNC
jgi:hypothetical protein